MARKKEDVLEQLVHDVMMHVRTAIMCHDAGAPVYPALAAAERVTVLLMTEVGILEADQVREWGEECIKLGKMDEQTWSKYLERLREIEALKRGNKSAPTAEE